jgi:hypothetical protein
MVGPDIVLIACFGGKGHVAFYTLSGVQVWLGFVFRVHHVGGRRDRKGMPLDVVDITVAVHAGPGKSVPSSVSPMTGEAEPVIFGVKTGRRGIFASVGVVTVIATYAGSEFFTCFKAGILLLVHSRSSRSVCPPVLFVRRFDIVIFHRFGYVIWSAFFAPGPSQWLSVNHEPGIPPGVTSAAEVTQHVGVKIVGMQNGPFSASQVYMVFAGAVTSLASDV